METEFRGVGSSRIGEETIMKKILVAALAATTLATPVLAESSDTATINMSGEVEQICPVVPDAGFGGANMPDRTYSRGDDPETGREHVRTQVTNAQLVRRLL